MTAVGGLTSIWLDLDRIIQVAGDIVHNTLKKLIELSVEGAKVFDLCVEGDKVHADVACNASSIYSSPHGFRVFSTYRCIA